VWQQNFQAHQQKFHMAQPSIPNFACNSIYFANCYSFAVIFRFPMNHKPHVCFITWHNQHPPCITHIIIYEWCIFTAFFSIHFTFILKWIMLDVKKFNTTAQANKKKQLQWSHIKQDKIHLNTFGVIWNRRGQKIWHDLPTM
jgi:hypothetical protein